MARSKRERRSEDPPNSTSGSDPRGSSRQGTLQGNIPISPGVVEMSADIGGKRYYSTPMHPRGTGRSQLVVFNSKNATTPGAYSSATFLSHKHDMDASPPGSGRFDHTLIYGFYDSLYPSLLDVGIGMGMNFEETDIGEQIERNLLNDFKTATERLWPLLAISQSQPISPVLEAVRRALRSSGRFTRMRNAFEDLTTLFNLPQIYWDVLDRYCTPTQADADSPLFCYGGMLATTMDDYTSGSEIDVLLSSIETNITDMRSTTDKLKFWELINKLLPKPNITVPQIRTDAGVVSEWMMMAMSYEASGTTTTYGSPALDDYDEILETFVPFSGVPEWYMTLFRPQIVFNTYSNSLWSYGYMPYNGADGLSGDGASQMQLYTGTVSAGVSTTAMDDPVAAANIDTQMWYAFPHARRAFAAGVAQYQGFVHPGGFVVDVPFSTLVDNTLTLLRHSWFDSIGRTPRA